MKTYLVSCTYLVLFLVKSCCFFHAFCSASWTVSSRLVKSVWAATFWTLASFSNLVCLLKQLSKVIAAVFFIVLCLWSFYNLPTLSSQENSNIPNIDLILKIWFRILVCKKAALCFFHKELCLTSESAENNNRNCLCYSSSLRLPWSMEADVRSHTTSQTR